MSGCHWMKMKVDNLNTFYDFVNAQKKLSTCAVSVKTYAMKNTNDNTLEISLKIFQKGQKIFAVYYTIINQDVRSKYVTIDILTLNK